MGGDLLTAVAAAAASSSLAATGVVGRNRLRRSGAARAEVKVRPILFAAIDAGAFDPKVTDTLTRTEDRALQAQARSLLPKLRGADRDTLGRLLERWGAVDAARRQGGSRWAATRARAGEFLGDSGSPAAVRDLVDLLHDPDPRVRWSAARGLGRLGHPSALSPLLGCLEGARAMPVDVVADAVFQIRDCPTAVLRQGLRSSAVPTRAIAVELLGRFQALALTSIDEVIDRLQHDPSVEVRARAARALGRMGSPRAVDALMDSVNDGPVAMRVQAVWALGEIGAPRSVATLEALLLGPARQMAEIAAAALTAMGPVGATALHQAAGMGGQPAKAAAQALADRADRTGLVPSRA
ncbi:MAG: HEAT repeat domain-containing protein [Actinomycetota bacterium]|nr:HEAT repeat domain-containing protein [Actinomycetota bacterium]